MYRMLCAAVGLMILIAPVLAGAAEPVVTELTLDDGRMQRMLFAIPENPRAVLVMLPGGNGMVEFGPDGGFRRMGDALLLRTLPLWQERGFAVAVLTPPNGMSLLGYRHTEAYAAAIGQAVEDLKGRTGLPVWLIGSSQGAIAAIGAAARLGDRLAGIVVMSSVTGRSSAGETVFDSEPGRVAVPVLIVANQGDACPASPPGDAAKIAGALTRAPRKDILMLESTPAKEQPCGPHSPHGYSGIEQPTIEQVARWIDATPRADQP
jgi:pimeloyl-ACP methyl ester carboxylesterase